MSRRDSRTSKGATPSASESHEGAPLARAAQEQQERETETAPGQLAAKDPGGGSPEASPSSYSSLLGQLRGSPSQQSVVLRRLQRSYGNNFVGKTLQAKLSVSQPGDEHEREADRIAQQVTTPPGTKSPASQSPAKKPDESLLQREGQGESDGTDPALERRLDNQRGVGSPLPGDVRASMESRMGADFTDVRIHTGGEASRLNHDLNAQAFTQGRDIYFGEGRYEPESGDGQRLLAHELTHVVQQSGAGSPEVIQRDPAPPQEKEQKQDPLWDVMGLMDDPFWSLDGKVFRLLHNLEIASLLHTLKALLNGGYLTRLMMSLGLATGVDTNRLDTAMQAVTARGMKTRPEAFALAHRAQLEKMKLDERLAILSYIGPIPSEPLGEVVKVKDTVYVIVQNEVRFGAEGDKTKTWRTNNPGALTVPQEGEAVSKREKEAKEALLKQLEDRAYVDPSNKHGYKYDEHEGGAKLAVFPTEKEGKAALRDKLKAFQEKGSSLKGFGSSQLGSVAAGEGYALLMVKLLKNKMNSPYKNIDVDTRMSRINIEDLVDVTQRREGWNPEDKGQLVLWTETEKLQALPAAVQFRVMLAQWMQAKGGETE